MSEYDKSFHRNMEIRLCIISIADAGLQYSVLWSLEYNSVIIVFFPWHGLVSKAPAQCFFAVCVSAEGLSRAQVLGEGRGGWGKGVTYGQPLGPKQDSAATAASKER